MASLESILNQLHRQLSDLIALSGHLTVNQWGCISLCAVFLGFVCLRGPTANRP